MGTCNGVLSTCYAGGFAFETTFVSFSSMISYDILITGLL